jgi:prepilin-type N-terminal cleavage/methylation domain-containing protein
MKKSPAKTRKYKNYFNIGFTLVELLIVIAILGGLAAVVTVAYPASQRRARDARRKSDLKQYQTALESYANANSGLYWTSVQVQADTIVCTALGFSPGECASDPRDGSSNSCNGNVCRYFYIGAATEYVFWAALEQPVTDDYWVLCSNGQSGEGGSVPTSSTCPL